MAKLNRQEQRVRRHERVRRKVRGTLQRPRLCVYKSHRHLYAQLIDDESGRTLLCASTLEQALRGHSGCNVASAELLGGLLAERATAQGIKTVVFDRGGYPYHGVVKALAERCREGGVRF